MGYSLGSTLIGVVISILLIITFFVIANRLYSIKKSLETLVKLELKKPVNLKTVTCTKCNQEYSVSKLREGILVQCPECKEFNRV